MIEYLQNQNAHYYVCVVHCQSSNLKNRNNNQKTRKKCSMSMETSSGWFSVKHLPFVGDLMMDFSCREL